jgi:hypothetical protein
MGSLQLRRVMNRRDRVDRKDRVEIWVNMGIDPVVEKIAVGI